MTGTDELREVRRARALEVVGLLGFLACLAWFLLHAYSLIVFSDPMKWYLFGRDFGERFADTRLAYGFPLLMRAAIALVGPFRAYLVNLPVLLALTALLYAFARLQVPTRHALAAPLGAAAALALLVPVDERLLLALTNPYRDALSYLFVLLAAVLVLSYRRRPSHPTAWVALAGVSLALACSTRETSALMLAPLLLYAVVSRWRDPELPLLRPTLVFGAAFALACLPLLVQNQLASGAALVPGQAASSYAQEGSLAPGIRLAQLSETLPDVVRDLSSRYGGWLPLLAGVGLVAAVRRRALPVLALSLPAFLLYGLFYGAYVRRVTRYTFVLDLFALAIAAAGAAVLADLLLDRLRRPTRAAAVALVALFAFGSWTAVEHGRTPRVRLTLRSVERFVQDFERATPPGATVVGMRPITDLVRGFTDHPLEEVRNFWDLQVRLPVLFGGEGERVLLARAERSERVVAREFDLLDVGRFDPADYGLDRHFGAETIRLSRVVPWTKNRSGELVRAWDDGQFVLAVDLGRLSKEGRSLTAVLWEGETIRRNPPDGINHFIVSVPRAPWAYAVELVSNRPVRSTLSPELRPLRKPIRLTFAGDRLLDHIERFSPSFLLRPWLGYPSVERLGHVDVPTVRPEGAAYVVTARLGLVPQAEAYERTVQVEAGSRKLGEWTLAAEAGAPAGAEPDWRDVSFVLHEPLVGEPRTRLQWLVLGADGADPGGLLGLRQIEVLRWRLRPTVELELAAPSADPYLIRGFGKRDNRGRMTRGESALRLLLSPSAEPGLLQVDYWGVGAMSSEPPRPQFVLNGEVLRGTRNSRSSRTSETFLLPRGSLERVENVLEIRPAKEGERILLRSVKLGPWRGLRGGRAQDPALR